MTDIELQLRIRELNQLTGDQANVAALLLVADAVERTVAELAAIKEGLTDLKLQVAWEL